MNYNERLKHLENLVISVMMANGVKRVRPLDVTCIAERAFGVQTNTGAKYAGDLMRWSTRLGEDLDGIYLK